ncbi:MAG: hypothetical protein AB1716_08420 [Planctomycetota bacterium]
MRCRKRSGRAQTAVLLALALAAAAWADTWFVRYDPATGLFPEQDNWERLIYPPPAVRSFENGALVIDSRASIYTSDSYRRYFPQGGLNPGSGEMFLMRWRLRIDSIGGPWDPGVDLISDDLYRVGFMYDQARMIGLVEPNVFVYFTPGVFHTYELWSRDMRQYDLSIDGRHARTGALLDNAAFPPPFVSWGDITQGGSSLSRWSFFEFGVVAQAPVGDLNCDGVVNFNDINPFVLALTDPLAYMHAYWACNILNGDTNRDGIVDFADISPFVALLVGE